MTREYIDCGVGINPAAGIWVKADPNVRKQLFYDVRRGTDLGPSATHNKAGNVGRWVVGEENQYELHVAFGCWSGRSIGYACTICFGAGGGRLSSGQSSRERRRPRQIGGPSE